MSPIIDIQNLTFLYPDKVAIENLSLSIPHGGITALTGPNGAGKTTLMRCIAGLEKPLEGGVHVCGFDMQTQQRQAHARMGFLPDNFGLYDDLTAIENLRFVGQCHNISSQLLKQRLEIIVRLFSLSGILTEKCESLSRGWRQRVGIAMVTIHKPVVNPHY